MLEQLLEREFRERMSDFVGSKNLNRFVCLVQVPKEAFIGYFGIDIPKEDPMTGWIFLFVQDEYQRKGVG